MPGVSSRSAQRERRSNTHRGVSSDQSLAIQVSPVLQSHRLGSLRPCPASCVPIGDSPAVKAMKRIETDDCVVQLAQISSCSLVRGQVHRCSMADDRRHRLHYDVRRLTLPRRITSDHKNTVTQQAWMRSSIHTVRSEGSVIFTSV
jgi:hypothetical protein